MKTIGLIGGTGWLSTLEYYRLLNDIADQRLGGLNSAKCLIYSVNYAEINALNMIGDSRGVFRIVLDAARKLEAAGADCLLLCANTLHQYVDELSKCINIPIVHVATATAREIRKRNLSSVGLLGTKMTMESEFYIAKLIEQGISVLVPEKEDRDFIHHTIISELLQNIILDKSRNRFLDIMDGLTKKGAEGIILGCTEIPLLVKTENTNITLFNTLQIHACAAADFAFGADD
jgi:aspartate racemase